MSACKPRSFTGYFNENDAGQVRAAFLASGHQEGCASVSELTEAATLREMRRLPRKYNQGRKWDPALPGSLRPGQRTREEQR